MYKLTYTLLTTLAAWGSAPQSSPPPGSDGPQGRPPHPPPAEAFEACEGANEGDVCDFEGPRGHSIVGTCHDGPEDLVCVPEGAPPPPPPRDG